MGGQLRDVPTFIVNFRLPWGILLAYFEIPELYLPFIRAGYVFKIACCMCLFVSMGNRTNPMKIQFSEY